MSSSQFPPGPPSPDPEKVVDTHTDGSGHEVEHSRGLVDKLLPKDPHIRRPLLIIIGPLPILFFIWIFFAVTFSRPIPLPDYLAVKAANHDQSTTMIVSMLGTALATFVAFLFSLAVRYAIVVRLATAEQTSLYFLTPMTCIAQNSLWDLNPRSLWAWIVAITYLGVSLQTSGLTSFLEVGEIAMSADISGKDLDLTNLELLRISNSADLPDTYDAMASFFLQNIMIDAMLIKDKIGNTFSFNGYNYVSTTGGIHPATYVPTHDHHFTHNATLAIPPNLEDISSRKHFNLPFNKTMQLAQQGFTADVDCRIGDPRDNATYRPAIASERIGTNGLAEVVLGVTCHGLSDIVVQAGPIVYNATDVLNSGFIIGAACLIPNTTSYDVIIRAAGAYVSLDYTTCTVVPKTTLVDVTYLIPPSGEDVATSISVSAPRSSSVLSDPVWGRMAVEMLLYNIKLAQSIQGNTMGNAWFIAPGVFANTTITQAMNTYIAAGIEFTGTIIRQLWTQPGSPAAPAGPTNPIYTTPIHGIFLASTQGWQQDHEVSPLFLLPTTLTIIATYCVLFYGVRLARSARSKGNQDRAVLNEDADFDPTDIVHIIAAQAPETRKTDFKSFSHGSTAWMKNTSVGMQVRDGVRTLAILPTQAKKGADESTGEGASVSSDSKKAGLGEKSD